MAQLTTSEAILSAAHKLFDRQGADAVTMRRVAKVVGITPMAIYRHFASRVALLKQVSDDSFRALARAWREQVQSLDVVQRPMALLEPYLNYALAHPHLFDHSFSMRCDDARRYPKDFRADLASTFNVVVEAITEGMRRGVLKEDDSYAVGMTIIAHQHGLIALYRAGRFSYNEAQFRKFYLESLGRLLDGIKV